MSITWLITLTNRERGGFKVLGRKLGTRKSHVLPAEYRHHGYVVCGSKNVSYAYRECLYYPMV